MIQLDLWRYEGAMALEAKTVDTHLVAKMVEKEKICNRPSGVGHADVSEETGPEYCHC